MISINWGVSNMDMDAQDSVNLNVKRSNTGTMMYGAGASQFYAKRSIIPIVDNVEVEDDNRRSSVKLTKLTVLQDGATRFPKLAECAHFHYEFVDFGKLELAVDEGVELDAESEQWFLINVYCNERKWTLRRTYDSLYAMDKQLHRCIYDRKFSMLPELTKDLIEEEGSVRALGKISAYLTRFSALADNMINCGPILCWMEMDNRGKRLVVPDNDAAVNIPAIGAAHVIKRYIAQSPDEISLEVGDILSIIDKPSAQESSWWRAKKEFEVGYFPSDYVEMIGSSKIPASVGTKVPMALAKPVLHRRGKVTSFLIGFFSSRPNRATLKRTGIVKERVFGCDLGEHLLNSAQDVPLVLKCCAEVLQKHGIVDGIYRLCGVASNLQKLRNEFDEDRIPDLTTEMYLQDIHCISSLVKMYFRELPNPLLTYQLYDKFTSAIDENSHDRKLNRLREIVQQLPPPHYRTTEFLFRHLSYMASCHSETSMHCKNLAIVWAPNLLRSKDLEQENCVAALRGAGLQAVVTEFLITNVDEIFDESCPCSTGSQESLLRSSVTRPKSLCTPQSGTKLLSLGEAQERALGTAALQQKYISVGGGPGALPPIYHTVIDLPKEKKTTRRTTVSNLRALFARNHSMTLPSSGNESPSSVQRKVSVVDEETLRKHGRTEQHRKQDETDSFCDLLEGKRRSVSCDVFDSALLDPKDIECHSYSSSLILKNSSVKYRGLSTDVTTENLPCPLESAVAYDVQPSLNSLHNNPVSFSGTCPSRRAPKPPPRSQITLDRSESVSRSSVSYAEQATLGDCQTPSGISMSSFGSEQVFCDELESKKINSFGNARFYTDFICNTDSLDTKLPSKNYEKMLHSVHDQDLQQQSDPLSKESDTGSSIRSENYYGSDRKMLSSEHAYKSLQDEQEFLSWKLSESSGSKDLLTELSPAINRVMPGSNICSSSVEDLGLSKNRQESSDMYDSCQSLNMIIPASCDIGSIPENIDGSFNEDSAKNKTSLHFSFSTLNIHSKQSEQLGNQDIIKEYQSEGLHYIKGSCIDSSQVPRGPQSPNMRRPDQIPASDILGQSVMRDSERLCQASVQSVPLSDESDVMHLSESLSFQNVDNCSLTGKCGIEVTGKDRDCVSIKDRSSQSKGISLRKREDIDYLISCTDVGSDRLSYSDQHSLPWVNKDSYKCGICSSSAKACVSASGMAQGCPHTDANRHPVEFQCNRSASATECGIRSSPTVAAASVHKKLSISEAEQNNCSSLVGLPFVSRPGIEEFSTQVENKENTTAGCRQRPSHMPLPKQSSRFKDMLQLQSPVADKEFRKDPKLLPVNSLLEDGTNSKNSFKTDSSLSGKGRSPDKMHSPVIADERIKSPSSSLRSVSSMSSSSAKTSKSERKKQSPGSNIQICQSASTGISPVTPLPSPSVIKESHFQTDNKSRIVSSRSSASEFFSDFKMTPDASQKDSEHTGSAIYAGLLRSRATRSEPPEVLRKQSAGTFSTRASAQVFKSSVSSFSPNTNPGMIPGASSSLKERRKLFESAVVNSTSNA